MAGIKAPFMVKSLGVSEWKALVKASSSSSANSGGNMKLKHGARESQGVFLVPGFIRRPFGKETTATQ